MTTQQITDYLTKQIFIERNIVTYRSLSRHFSIHVNEAKNELATYHHDAPYQSQKCAATFFLSGVSLRQDRNEHDEDVDMDSPSQQSQEEEDGEEAPQTLITIVNERDLEAAKSSYAELDSIHIYSVAPAPIHDAGLLCAPTEIVRNTDREKGPAFSVKLGRVVGKGIKMGVSKRKTQPAAGPSKLKMPEPKVIPQTEATTAAAVDKAKDKPKATGKLQFFSKPKESVKTVKKEEEPDTKKKMFFSKPATAVAKGPVTSTEAVATKVPTKSTETVAAKEPVIIKTEKFEPVIADAAKVKIGPPRGIKRKSSIIHERKEKSPGNPAMTAAAADNTSTRARRRVVLSDDESDSPVSKPAKSMRRKAKYESESDANSEAEREAMALMDIDDDQVERVSRVPSTHASSDEYDGEDDEGASSGVQDEDVSMEDDAPVKPKPRAKKPKVIIPVGRNGLNKRKVTKTRRTMDANGYMHKEDYSDWESVEEGEEPVPEPVKAKGKAKVKPAAKAEVQEENQEVLPPPPKPVKEKVKEKELAPAKKAPVKAAPKLKPPAKGAQSVKGKQQTLNFFGPKKT